VKVSKAKKKLQKEDLPFSDLAENWQRPLDDALSWFRKQSTTAQDGLKKDLVVSILEATCNGKEKWNKEESEEFAQFMIDEIQNKAKAMSGKKRRYGFRKGRFALHLPCIYDRKWVTRSTKRTHLSVYHPFEHCASFNRRCE
jgi:DNA mismatch repair ATPase MutS